MLHICANIKKYRELSEKSQDEIATKMGITRGSYKNWELETEPNLSTIKTIAQAIGVPPYKLLEGIIDFSEDDTPNEPIEIIYKTTKKDLEKIRLSLNALDIIFSPERHLKKGKNQAVQELKSEGRKKPHLSKSVKERQRGND